MTRERKNPWTQWHSGTMAMEGERESEGERERGSEREREANFILSTTRGDPSIFHARP